MENFGTLERLLCNIQGKLFELAFHHGYDCPAFIEAFMNSHAAAALDDTYDRLQWAGEEYILEELEDEAGGLKKAGVIFPLEVMYWAGYVYRYWHYYSNDTSRDIYRIADASTMDNCWLGFHTLDVELAIENLVELHQQTSEG